MRNVAVRAFTLVELLIVVVIVSILVAIVIPQFPSEGDVARAKALAELDKIIGTPNPIEWHGIVIERHGDSLLFVQAGGDRVGGVISAYTKENQLELVSMSNLDQWGSTHLGYWVVVKPLAKMPAESPVTDGKK